jgi:hypothetical protein
MQAVIVMWSEHAPRKLLPTVAGPALQAPASGRLPDAFIQIL